MASLSLLKFIEVCIPTDKLIFLEKVLYFSGIEMVRAGMALNLFWGYILRYMCLSLRIWSCLAGSLGSFTSEAHKRTICSGNFSYIQFNHRIVLILVCTRTLSLIKGNLPQFDEGRSSFHS